MRIVLRPEAINALALLVFLLGTVPELRIALMRLAGVEVLGSRENTRFCARWSARSFAACAQQDVI